MTLSWAKLNPDQRQKICLAAGMGPRRAERLSRRAWTTFNITTMQRLLSVPWWAALHGRVRPADVEV